MRAAESGVASYPIVMLWNVGISDMPARASATLMRPSDVPTRYSWNSAQSRCHVRSSAFSPSKMTGGATSSNGAARLP